MPFVVWATAYLVTNFSNFGLAVGLLRNLMQIEFQLVRDRQTLRVIVHLHMYMMNEVQR